MNTIRDALLSSFEPDAIVIIRGIDLNQKKKDKLFDEVRDTLIPKYKILADKVNDKIYIQY